MQGPVGLLADGLGAGGQRHVLQRHVARGQEADQRGGRAGPNVERADERALTHVAGDGRRVEDQHVAERALGRLAVDELAGEQSRGLGQL